ncbi:sigma-70 family RNA polymerase sigma factor [Saccharibacillus alkalitolerans]|uniref:Sigma-70 family RNA polymerase sigma factor n=1 Tax=Saccharibacillus alkalitolerans TaxID=2705290 RepID=A0ABX0FCM9_9BACL|nr:sigma-70 family RNA polymerase sigma factor [Saccharibacillus alkalitolerans]NGZ77358.1 sigma-70 family RNA polymerase sigma factor [Saccharibacillus alkalitolerans]
MAETLRLEQTGERAIENEEERFFERIDRQSGRLYSIAYSYLRSDADALEMLQEASFRAWSKKKSLKDEALFDSWLIRILINCCMDELRRRKRVVPVERVGEERGAAEMRSSSRIDLERAMANMPEKYRHVLTLRFYHDMTLGEIARILNKPESTVKTRLYRALKQMRSRLEQER